MSMGVGRSGQQHLHSGLGVEGETAAFGPAQELVQLLHILQLGVAIQQQRRVVRRRFPLLSQPLPLVGPFFSSEKQVHVVRQTLPKP
jgi:hypothetical protein